MEGIKFKDDIEETFEAKCINAENRGELVQGQTYLVKESKFYTNYYEIDGHTYKKERFKLQDNKLVVKCIKGNGNYLNTGEEYLVEREEENYYIIKINDVERNFKKSKFEEVEEPNRISTAEEFKVIMPINYEEEYYKLKEEVEKTKNEENIKLDHGMQLLQSENDEYIEALEKVRTENRELEEQVKRLGKSTNEYYYNWIKTQEERDKEIKELKVDIEGLKKEKEDN